MKMVKNICEGGDEGADWFYAMWGVLIYDRHMNRWTLVIVESLSWLKLLFIKTTFFVSDQVCLSVVASISKIVNECCVGTIVILTHMITLSYVSTPDTRRHWQLYKWVFGRVLIPTGICQITLCIQFQIQDNNKVYSCWVSPRYSIEHPRFSLTGHLT